MDVQAKQEAITKAAEVAGAESPTLLEKLEVERAKYEADDNDEMAEFIAELMRKITAEKKRLRRTAEARRKKRKSQKAARKRNR